MTDLPDNAVSALNIMPSTAAEVARFSIQIVRSVKNGEVNPLKILILLRSLEAVSELVREEIGDEILTEAEKHSEKKFEAFGAIVEKSELGTKYNYESSKDLDWEQLNTAFKYAENKRKEREIFLRALKEPLTLVNEDTGEVYKINPPQKTSESGVKVFLK